MIVPANAETIRAAAALLRAGQVVSFPTETVYGLGANALLAGACEKIFRLKNRPPTNPLIVHVHSTAGAEALVDPSFSSSGKRLFERLSALWPGPVTAVVPKRETIPDIVTAGTGSVGIRIPANDIALALLREASIPVAAPSANLSNYVSPTTARHVYDGFGEDIPIILDGGGTALGLESTVISLVEPANPVILRPGTVTKEILEETLGCKVRAYAGASQSASPGLGPVHYAPSTPLALLKDIDLGTVGGLKLGFIAFREGLHLEYDFHSVIVLSANGSLPEIATGLYGALRDMDARDLDLIVIDECIETGVGTAIMDRVRKAAALHGRRYEDPRRRRHTRSNI